MRPRRDFEALEFRLSRIESVLARCEVDYTSLGNEYHCIPLGPRASLSPPESRVICEANFINDREGNAPEMVWSMRSATISLKFAKETLRRENPESLLDAARRMQELENEIADMQEKIALLRHDAMQIVARHYAATGTADRARGVERLNHMSVEQQRIFHDWAMQLREVEAAIKLNMIAADGVDEFVLDDRDRFIIEDPEDPAAVGRGDIRTINLHQETTSGLRGMVPAMQFV